MYIKEASIYGKICCYMKYGEEKQQQKRREDAQTMRARACACASARDDGESLKIYAQKETVPKAYQPCHVIYAYRARRGAREVNLPSHKVPNPVPGVQ